MKKIKVLHLELDGHLGGIESFLYNLYSEIDREKVQFDFITRSDNPAKANELRKLGANIYKISSYKYPLRYMSELDKVITDGKYDIVHIHKNSAAVILPFLVTRKHKDIGVFVHSHNTQPSVCGVASILHKINKNFLYKSADKRFACSYVAGEWLYGKNKDFMVVRNGIVASKFLFDKMIRKKIREQLGISEDTLVVGHVGRFTAQKNQEQLVHIFCEILKNKPDSKLLLIGDGENKEKIQKEVLRLKIKDSVLFLGVRKDINELLMAMDVFIMPSLYEGLPISAVEAQATGVKTFLADTISKETELSSEVNWFSIDDSAGSIAKIIIKKCDEESTRTCCNTEVVNAGFAMEETAKMLENTYISVMRENSRKEKASCT